MPHGLFFDDDEEGEEEKDKRSGTVLCWRSVDGKRRRGGGRGGGGGVRERESLGRPGFVHYQYWKDLSKEKMKNGNRGTLALPVQPTATRAKKERGTRERERETTTVEVPYMDQGPCTASGYVLRTDGYEDGTEYGVRYLTPYKDAGRQATN